jgi:hypothetical protein
MFEKCIDFIDRNTRVNCAIDHTIQRDEPTAMWPGISLVKGALFVNPDIADVGDFLHEVGHLVTVPMYIRYRMTGEIGNDLDIITELFQYGKSFSPCRSPSDDDAATYWAVCMCKELGFSLRLPFENGYDNEWDNEELKGSDIMDYVRTVQYPRSRFSVAAYHAGLLNENPHESSGTAPPLDRWDIES